MLLVLLLAVVQPAAAGRSAPLVYTVLRNGEPVGVHSVTVQPSANGVDVSIETTVVIKALMITLYHFQSHVRETWEGGHVKSMESTTDDNGDAHQVRMAVNGDVPAIVVDGKALKTRAADLAPASFWNAAAVRTPVLVDTYDGTQMAVTVAFAGEDTVSVRGIPVRAHHYVVDGELRRDLWYDSAGTLVQMHLKADEDGSDIVYALK
jgi:hypothetical protein